jgi:hypothetical protein
MRAPLSAHCINRSRSIRLFVILDGTLVTNLDVSARILLQRVTLRVISPAASIPGLMTRRDLIDNHQGRADRH